MEPLSIEQVRVLGCLVEKSATVPDAYPLTLNALRQACNQSSSRDPIVAYDDGTVLRSLDALKAAGLVRFVHPALGERATKYRHVVGERLELHPGELAVLAVLALRGPQTSAELRARTERAHAFASAGEVEAVLAALAGRDEPLVVALPRLAGQRDGRWAHLLGGPVDVEALAASVPSVGGAVRAGVNGGAERIAAIEQQVAALQERLARLERELGVELPS